MRFNVIYISNFRYYSFFPVVTPFHIHGTPSKSGTKRSENNVIAFLKFLFQNPRYTMAAVPALVLP